MGKAGIQEEVEGSIEIPEEKIDTVADLAKKVRNAIEKPQLQAAHVIGEVTNSREWKGNQFFTLKDKNAKIQCIIFEKHIQDYRPQEGDRIVARGKVDFYQEQGKLSLKANLVEPVGEGKYYKKLRKVKKELKEKGLFDREKQPDKIPEKVGIVTAETGDALKDVRRAIENRMPGTDILLAPASVQGEKAEEEIIKAIEKLEESEVDTIIIARGGGDIEALQPFNSKRVAKAIYSCEKPIISGIGHKEDETVAGLVADVRGITPTDAGRKAVAEKQKLVEKLEEKERKLGKTFENYKAKKKQERREKLYKAAIILLLGVIAALTVLAL
ncbi:MAG: exodeoxyribonuclease VII large subunit [Candidatus Nanohaloarchaeota archaeon QJJ-9]|nr:exodeoxyribonuclease VII large subunit [Candidatus Nanohaloarchaeota archaeon QJJ-9]